MIRAYTADEVRAAERPLLEAGEPLMLRAASAVSITLAETLRVRTGRISGARCVLLVGPGSNGGDALWAGALLARRGVGVRALAVSERLHEEGAAALRSAGGRIERTSELTMQEVRARLAEADVLCDGVLGIGGRPQLADDLAVVLRAANDASAPIVAVDVPSGVDATAGVAAADAIRADRTVVLGAMTTGLLLPGAAAHVGMMQLVDLGLGPHLPERAGVRRLELADARALWPVPGAEAHKYSRGVVALEVGSAAFPGAAVLCAEGAARAGAGMVRLRAPQTVRDLVLARRPEVVGADGRHQALVVGSGLEPEDPRCRAGVEELLEGAGDGDGRDHGPAVGVIDAGALGAIRPGDRFAPSVVLTPHTGEASRLADALGIETRQGDGTDPARLATALARATGATVLLKEATTLVAPGDDPERLLSQADATPWLATAGAGDVLAGLLGTLLAAGLPGPMAAALAALVHGRAARHAARGGIAPLVALDVAESIPAAVASILDGTLGPSVPGGGA